MTVTLKDGVIVDDTTGEYARTAKLGARPTSPTAVTQTYSTADVTVAAATVAAVATTGATQSSPFGYVGATQANDIPVAINALAADVLVIRKVQNTIIDVLQAAGFLS
jgi:hypothetical protein